MANTIDVSTYLGVFVLIYPNDGFHNWAYSELWFGPDQPGSFYVPSVGDLVYQSTTKSFFEVTSVDTTGINNNPPTYIPTIAYRGTLLFDISNLNQEVTQAQILAALLNQRSLEEIVWIDTGNNNTYCIRKSIYNPDTQQSTISYVLPNEIPYTVVGPLVLALSNADKELRNIEYRAIANSSGNYSIDDVIIQTDIIDTTTNPVTITTIYKNKTTGQVIPTPLFSDLQDNNTIGKVSDTSAPDNTGNYSLMSFIKRISATLTTIKDTIAGIIQVKPKMTSSGHLQLTTNTTGATFTTFSSQSCLQCVIFNNNNTTVEVQQDATGIAIPIQQYSKEVFFGITNTNQLGVRRFDQNNGVSINVQLRWEG